MPNITPISATFAPIAPMPITPKQPSLSSLPLKDFFPLSMCAFKSSFETSSIPCTNLTPSKIPLDDINKAAKTISLTAFALAPGVLKTGIPIFEHSSTGILLTPAPALTIALTEEGISLICNL